MQGTFESTGAARTNSRGTGSPMLPDSGNANVNSESRHSRSPLSGHESVRKIAADRGGKLNLVLRKPHIPTLTYVIERDNAAFESRVELWLAGFSAQHLVTTDEIVAAVNRVPNVHLEGLRGIIYDPDRVTQELAPIPEPWRFRVKGAFFKSERCVVVYEFTTRPRFDHILYHEIGHYVFQYILDSFKRKRWVTELYPDLPYVTPVASRNANEDFAESYATFLCKPQRLLQIPKKHAFMRTEVFKRQIP